MDAHTAHPLPLPGMKPRARRFDMKLPLRFRVLPAEVWHQGELENISRSGVLFRAGVPLDVADRIELAFSLAEVNADSALATVVCEARVARTQSPDSASQPPVFAATITRYRLVPTADEDSRD